MANTFDFEHHDPRFPGCYQLLLDIAKDPKASAAIKVAALAAASKVEPKYLHHPVDLPTFSSISEAETYKLGIAQREARNELDAASVSRIYSRIDNWINDQRADATAHRLDAELELKRINSELSDRPQIIKIEGGLPALPGSDIITPQLNGHEANFIDHQPAQPHPDEESKSQ
jgi:hypothetical protein